VNLLLDTHILIWLITGDRRLNRKMRDAFAFADQLQVSAVVAFEYAELLKKARIPVTESLAELIDRFELRIAPLPTEAWEVIARSPDVLADPVDRMLVAHAMIAKTAILTADRKIRRYPVETIW
jgi:PIN domain nuclease of toxin-antitoxin system